MLNQANDTKVQEHLTDLQEAKQEKPPIVFETKIDLDLSQEQMLKNTKGHILASFAQNEVKDIVWRIQNNCFNQDDLKAVNGFNLAYASYSDLKDLLNALLGIRYPDGNSAALYRALHTTALYLTSGNENAAAFLRTVRCDTFSHLLRRAAPDRMLSQQLVDKWTEARLLSLAKSLDDPSLREYYLSPERDLKELMSVVQYISEEERVSFALELAQMGLKNPSTDDVITDKLDNLLHYYSQEEKAEILSAILSAPQKYSPYTAPAVLRSSENLEELVFVVNEAGADSLLALQDEETGEYVSIALLAPQIRAIELPPISTEEGTAEERAKLLQDVFKEAEEILSLHPELAETSAFKDYQAIIDTLRSDFNRELEGIADGDTSLLNSLVNRYIKQTELSFKYILRISTGDSDYLDETSDNADIFVADIEPKERAEEDEGLYWRFKDLYDLQAVLERIPEGDLLMTPLLRDIELVNNLGWGVLGARYSDGRIKIAALSLDLEELSEQYEGVSSLKIVLAHEIGHGIQIGDNASDIVGEYGKHPAFGEGEPVIDFDEFYRLAGWEVYSKDRYYIDEESGDIILDGKSIPLESPVEFEGRMRVFQYDPWYNILTSYYADGEFSSRWYAKTSPWEDFAEAFSEYLFLPERLIEDAPHKFKHLDEEFKVYEKDKYIQGLLEKRLKQRGESSSH